MSILEDPHGSKNSENPCCDQIRFSGASQEKPIEKITVTELAKLAEINKATFYLHYSDIYSLADEMEDEVIDDILSEIQGLNKFFDDPRKYTAEMRRALLNSLSTLNSVFSGSRYSGFAEKIEERIKARLYAEFPNLKSRRNDIVLSFIIQGTFHTIATSAGKEVPDSEDLETIARLTDHIITELKPADE